jgi:Protein of unknown function (DUF998)
VGVCELVLASGVRAVAAHSHRSQIATYLIAISAVWSFGVAIFADPHPLHGVFGNVGLIAMLSPLAFAWSWRRDPQARVLVFGSGIFGIIVWAGIFAFVPYVQRPAELQLHGGVIQRLFLFSWMMWLGFVGILLRKRILHSDGD